MKLKTFLSAGILCLSVSPLMAQTHLEGEEYYKADQFANAKELLLRNMNNSGTDKAVSNYYLGLISLKNNNPQEAEQYFNAGIQANPEYGYNYVGLGQIILKKGDVKEAQKMFKEAEARTKKDPSMQIAIARAYESVDPVAYAQEVSKRVEKARKHDMKNPDIYLFEGDQLAEKKDFGGAAAKYEMATSYDPNASEAYVKYANLFTMVNPEYAIKMLNNLLQVNPTSALAQRELANAYYNNKNYKEAAAQYGKYVTNPNHFKQDEDRYSFLLFYGGDYQGGYDYATKLLASNPQNFTAQRYQFMNAAQIPSMKEQLLPMAESLYAAHKANPTANKFASIDYTLIADELQTAKRPEEAVAVLEEGIANMPDNASFNKQLAMVYVDENKIGNAADAYEGYLSKLEKPGYNDYVQQATFSYYGGVENKTDDPAKSDKYFADCLKYAALAGEILPDNYKPKKFAGDVAKQKADKETLQSAAAPAYEEAVVLLEASQDPSRYKSDAKEMYNYLGNYYLDKKDVAKAKEYFNKYLVYDPDNADYRKFVESLK